MITTEFQPSKVARARENLLAGGLADLIGLREGDALHTLAHDLPDHIYLELLDGANLWVAVVDRAPGEHGARRLREAWYVVLTWVPWSNQWHPCG